MFSEQLWDEMPLIHAFMPSGQQLRGLLKGLLKCIKELCFLVDTGEKGQVKGRQKPGRKGPNGVDVEMTEDTAKVSHWTCSF